VTVVAPGDLQFTVTGPAAASLIIETTTALDGTWTPVATNSPFNGSFQFEDHSPGTIRFYRTRIP